MRVGVILASVNAVLEPEFYAMAPKGVTFHISRFLVSEGRGTVKSMEMAAVDAMNESFKMLPRVNLVVVGVTAPSFIRGAGGDKDMAESIERATGLPVITTSTAVVEALREMKIKKVAVGTPYLEATQEKLKEFLEGNGFDVVSTKSIRHKIGDGVGSGYLQPDIPLEAVYDLGREVDRPEADGVFLSCTNMRTIDVIDALELSLKKPVVTSSQATMWAILRKLQRCEPRERFGRLLERIC